MVEFVAHQLAVGTVERQVHTLDQNGKDAIDRDIVGRLDFMDAAAGDVGNFDSDVAHKIYAGELLWMQGSSRRTLDFLKERADDRLMFWV